MKVSQFCDGCAATGQKTNVKGFDFAVLLPLVLQMVVGFLSKCGDDDVVQRIEKRDFWAQYAVRSSVKQAAREEGVEVGRNLRAVSDVILDTAQQVGEANVRSMLEEARSNVPDFDRGWV
jgi:hypothetical protein